MRKVGIVALIVLFAPAVLWAQPLADRLPDDAEIYVGWNGTDAPGAGFDQSHLEAVLDASQLGQFFQDSVPRLLHQVGMQNPEGAQHMRQVYEIMMAMARHHGAIYLGGPQAGGPPIPKLAILCDAGPDAPRIQQAVQNILNEAHGAPLNLHVFDTLVVLSDFDFPDHIDKPLSQNAEFQAALGQLGKDPSAVLYVNSTALLATVDAMVGQMAPPDAQQMWPQIRDSLGLGGLKAIAGTAGFDGKNWMVQGFINAPAPRHGLLAMGDVPPISDDLLKRIPDTATMAGAGTCDLNALFTQIDQAVVKFAPDHGDQFHQAVGQINQMLGFDIQKDFLAALGTQWAYFCDPTLAGDGPMGFVIVNQPRNADQLQNSLNQLETVANAMIAQQFRNNRPKLTIQFRRSTINGAEIHYLATPLISPSWTVKDGSWYAGLFPQVVDAAVDRPADAKSIKDSPVYQATMKALGAPAQFSSFGFIDLPRLMPSSYQACLALSQLYFGAGDLFDMQAPPMILPPLPKLMAETEPAGSVSWMDDAGFHFKGIEPFPGSTAFGSAQGISTAGVGEVALMTSILLPSLNRARETANRVKCASNMRQIGMAILLYSNDMKGAYPPDLGTLLKTEDITAAVFVCPDTGKSPPPGMSPDEAADWVNKNTDYVYIGSNLKQGAAPSVVVCYEKPEDHGNDGQNILFGDGHIEFCKPELAQKLINDSTNPK
jgi:hypothetical protein